MRRSKYEITGADGNPATLQSFKLHTLVIGSGAAGLNAAVQLRQNGVSDIAIVTEGLDKGTSINTGSDKQTYYKLSLCGSEGDSPVLMSESYFSGGSMHGDLALIEASLSVRTFSHLVNLGVPFPRDRYGQFVGYKTDHDPRQRATSIGPYTSREMCKALIARAKELDITILEGRTVVSLLTVMQDGAVRIAGALAMNAERTLEVYFASNVVFGVGGPGGLYKTSVYPQVHTGAIGLALMAGAKAQSLPESQYGLASTKFRWNVSGTYMQVIPKFISTDADGSSNPREFMGSYFKSIGEMNSNVFLKGYQWPFGSRKVVGGSSIVDILVYIENVINKRRVFLDFRANPDGYRFEDMSQEARDYLTKSKASGGTPIERLAIMNPGAIQLYKDHGIDITTEPLEVAVCAQHNNGGIAGNAWWESLNVKHLFPVGEVNGSHGVYRPGGSALNSGQVAGFRAAEFIANRYQADDLSTRLARKEADKAVADISSYLAKCATAPTTWQKERSELCERMTQYGAHIRSSAKMKTAIADAWKQYRRLRDHGCSYTTDEGPVESLRNLQLCFAHAVYLDAISFALESGAGSRGSSIALQSDGKKIHDGLTDDWRIASENSSFRDKVQETIALPDGRVTHSWVQRRPLPPQDSWFETIWAKFRQGEIYVD